MKLNYGLQDVVINWAGGLHHAKKSEAGRICPLQRRLPEPHCCEALQEHSRHLLSHFPLMEFRKRHRYCRAFAAAAADPSAKATNAISVIGLADIEVVCLIRRVASAT